jgi:molybdenum cofactor cytidylyltransferase
MIGAIILAAGDSKRFGQPKQLMLLDGRPMLQQTIDRVSAARVDDLVIVLGAGAAAIRKQIHGRTVTNDRYTDGLSTSLHAGLRELTGAEAVVVALGDQPFVRSRTIDALIDEYRRTRAKIVVPSFRGVRGNPVVIDRSLFPRLMQIRGDVGCRAIFGEAGVHEVAVGDEGVTQDIDTMEDFECRTRHSS